MLSDRMAEALNAHLNAELYSSYLYLSMEASFQADDLTGFANLMHVQALEEFGHARRFAKYINDRDGRVILRAIDGPPTHWDSPRAAFEEVLEHERKVSGLIHQLLGLAIEEKDHSTSAFLQWFVTEQVEEEATAKESLQKVKLVDESAGGLYLLDREFAQRSIAPGDEDAAN